MKHALLPAAGSARNLLVGIPILVTSYEACNLHHAARYGTVEDPEYLPLALMETLDAAGVPACPPLLLPVAMLIHFAVLAPLSACSRAAPRRRRRYSDSRSIRPSSARARRAPGPSGSGRTGHQRLLVALLALVATKRDPFARLVIYLVVIAGWR